MRVTKIKTAVFLLFFCLFAVYVSAQKKYTSDYSTKPWEVASKSADISAFYMTKGNDLYVIFTKYPIKAVTIKGVTKFGRERANGGHQE